MKPPWKPHDSHSALERLRQLETAIQSMQVGVTIADLDGRIIYVNPADAQMHGFEPEELIGKDVGIYAPEATKRRPMSSDELRQVTSWSRESVNRRRDGSTFPVQLTSDVVFDDAGRPIAVVSSCRDLTEAKRTERALRESEDRYALAVRGANDGLWDWDLEAGVINYSPRWLEMLGIAGQHADRSPELWFSRVHPDDLAELEEKIEDHLAGRMSQFENEHRLLHSDRGYRWMRSRGLAYFDAAGRAVRMAGAQADITDLKVKDPLTGLPNRVLLLDHLGLALARARRKARPSFAVLFLDLDRFKVINDSLGHLAGDRLLVSIAHRIEGCLRPGDTVARYGGDEFTILVEEIGKPADAVQVADRMLDELAEPFDLEGQEVFVSGSIGITLGSREYEGAEELLRDADLAMYRAKGLGGGRYQIFNLELRDAAKAQLAIETDLRHAIERHELRVFYQPIVRLTDQQLVGFEALVRWQHPERGLLAPVDFLTIAEDSGLIVPIGWWVTETACRRLADWRRRFEKIEELTIGVNFAGRQLVQPDLVDRVVGILEQCDLPADRLAVEITETVLLDHSQPVVDALSELRRRGVRICLDDFGTGYSSFSYLQQFPIDTLKIDRSFVSRLDLEGKGAELVRSIINLGGELEMVVIAEGIESNDQLESLRSLNCALGQGFSFSEPLSEDAAGDLISKLER